jgi:L-lactate dehydrogenase (cytochrome)
VKGLVFDITEFLRLHPGGSNVLLSYAGQDATKAFEAKHGKHEFFTLYRSYIRGIIVTDEVGTTSVRLSLPVVVLL